MAITRDYVAHSYRRTHGVRGSVLSVPVPGMGTYTHMANEEGHGGHYAEHGSIYLRTLNGSTDGYCCFSSIHHRASLAQHEDVVKHQDLIDPEVQTPGPSLK